jgi:EmrB/QacA subfamily drug resistance transporter
MGQLDASVVTLTYRPVQAEFHAALAGVEWVSLAYLLTLIALLVPVGRLSDAHGRKLLYLYGFVVFTGASAACGLASTLAVLIGFRVVQAVGASLLQANSVALVTTSAPETERRRALGIQAGAQALGLALGPSLGGILVSTVGWRWVFFINVPIGVVAVVAGYFLLPRTRQRSPETVLDWVSVVVLGVATTGLMLGLSAASGLSVTVPVMLAFFAVSAGTSRAFVVRQSRVARPLVDLTLFSDPRVLWGLVGAMCGYLVLFGPLVLIPVVLSEQGVSALAAGLILTALPAGFAVAAVVGEAILPAAMNDRHRASLGALICAAVLAAGLTGTPTPKLAVPLLVVLGVGLGVFTPSNNTTIMGAIPTRVSATGGGLLNLTRGLGTALGVALVTLAWHLGSGRSALVSGDRLAMIVLLVAAGVAVLASRLARRPKDAPPLPGPVGAHV